MAGLEMISAGMLKEYRERPDVLLIDLRSKEDYDAYHIEGACHIAYEDAKRLRKLPKDRLLILYCERGASSMVRAKELAKEGYRVKTLIGGIHAYLKECRR